MAAARELTKKFEEIVRGTPIEVLNHFTTEGIRGEFVLLLHGAEPALPEEKRLRLGRQSRRPIRAKRHFAKKMPSNRLPKKLTSANEMSITLLCKINNN